MDGIYQCYQKNYRVESVIENFFDNGGDKIYLMSDAGNDFSYLTQKYNNRIIYHYNMEKSWCDREGWVSKSQAILWSVLFTEGCRKLNSKYIMILEDDVLLRGNINDIKIHSEIMGARSHPGNQLPTSIQEYVYNIDGKNIPFYYYGGGGGSIINREIISSGDFPYIVNTHYYPICKLSKKMNFNDSMLTFMYRILGHEYKENPEHIETWEDSNWRNRPEKIVHQYDV